MQVTLFLRFKMTKYHVMLFWILLFSLAFCNEARPQAPPSDPPKSVRLQLHWIHQAQFAGFYIAKEKGFFSKRGLEVEILRGGPDIDPIAAISDGTADFCTCFLTGAILAKDKGCDLVHIGQIVNRSNLELIAHKNAGIQRPADLQGRKVSLWGELFRAAFLGFFESSGVTPKIVPQHASVNLFLRGGADACAAMHYNEYHLLVQAGMDHGEMTCFMMCDSGFGFPEDGIYCMREMARKEPELGRKLVEASVEGWQYAARHKKEALDITMRYVLDTHVPTNRSHMKWMLDAILPSILPPDKGGWVLGSLSSGEYDSAANQLFKHGFIKRIQRFGDFSAQGEIVAK